jgi:hypothetical protein
MRSLLDRLFVAALVLLFIAFVAFSAYGTFRYGRDVFRAYVLSNSWHSVPGTITSSRAVQGCGRSRYGYYLEVTYRYHVDGNELVSNRVWFGNGYCSGKAAVTAKAAEFVAGTSRSVYVNTTDSTDSVLVRGKVENGTMFLLSLLSATSAGALILISRAAQDARISNRSRQNVEQLLIRREKLDRSIRIEIEERTANKALAEAKRGDA